MKSGSTQEEHGGADGREEAHFEAGNVTGHISVAAGGLLLEDCLTAADDDAPW